MTAVRLRPHLLIAMALAFAVAACSSGGETTADPSTPTLTAATASGGQIDLTSLEGQDTVLWFWAPW